MKIAIWILVLSSLVGCASVEKSPAPTERPVSPPPRVTSKPESAPIDLVGLKSSLGMDRPAQDLGYREKPFDSCRVGYGFSSVNDCQALWLVVMNFRIQCRMSEGTVTTLSADDIHPVMADHLRWNLGKVEGWTSTDPQGFGQFVAVVGKPHRQQRLRLTWNGNFLVQTAEEMTRVVATRDWCR